MNSTSHADEIQEEEWSLARNYASSEFERGLMANAVAKRCEQIPDAAARALIWFVQFLSWSERGLKGLAQDLGEAFSGEFATEAMQRFGVAPGQIYNAEQSAEIRASLPNQVARRLPLRGDHRHGIALAELGEDQGYAVQLKERDALLPNSYPAEKLMKICRGCAFDSEFKDSLINWLGRLCLDPSVKFDKDAPWYFPRLAAALRKFQAAWIAQRQEPVVITELGQQLYDTLDYALQSRVMVLIDGLARTGKSFSAKAWCETHPGQVRYVQVPSSSDENGFFRAIAMSLGSSANYNAKSHAHRVRDRVEDVLQRGDLMIVFDEAHYLWPQSNYRHALPVRVNWIMTALVNKGVPVALITTPQFIRSQKLMEQRSSWTGEQFTGRIGHYKKLPDSLSEADLAAVAKSLFPEGDERAIEYLVAYAQGSARYLAGIEAIVRRARFLAAQEKRQKVLCGDVKRVIQESVIPSDSALAQAFNQAAKPSKRTGSTVSAIPLQQDRRAGIAGHNVTPALETNDLPAEAGAPDLAGSRSVKPASSLASITNRRGGEFITS